MPNSTWTETGVGISLAPSTTPVSVSSSPEDVNYLTNSDKIKLMAQYSAELATKTSLDTTAGSLDVSSTAYDNAIAAINTTLVNAGAPANWATIWPDGTTFGPSTGIQTSLSNDWEQVATQRAALQSAISSAQAAQAQAAATSAAAADATSKMNAAVSIAAPIVVSGLPALPNATYPSGKVVWNSGDNKLYQSTGSAWTVLVVSGTNIEANTITAGQIAAGAIGADQIAAGSIAVDKLTVTPIGSVINYDPAMADPTAWTASGNVVLNVGPTSLAGAVGGLFTDCVTGTPGLGAGDVVFTTKAFAIDPNRSYKLSAALYGGSASGAPIYIYVDFYNAAGTETITTTWGGLHSGYVYGAVPAANNAFNRYGDTFGAGTSRPIPLNAALCRVGILFQYSDGPFYEQAAQDLRLETVVDASLIVDGAITTAKITAGGIAADVIKTGTLDASVVTVANINADNITAGTLSAAKIIFSKDGSSVDSAARVSTSSVQASARYTVPDNNANAFPGLGWSVVAESGDTFNVFAALRVNTAGSGMSNPEILIVVDGNTAAPKATYSLPSSGGNQFIPVFASVTGLISGAHTIQIYVSGANGYDFSNVGTYAICQRIF